MIEKKLIKSILNHGIYVSLLIIENYAIYSIIIYKITSTLNNTL